MSYRYLEQPIIDLIPHANNSRTHSDEQIGQIAASINEWGFTNPVLVDEDNSIIAGHGRVTAARKVGMDTVPCIVMAGLTDTQRKAYVIADNKLALNAGWDEELLALELKDLSGQDFDIGLIGFNIDELDALLNGEAYEGLTDEDAVPEVPETPTSVLGDVWILSKHRLMCGDSTSVDAVEKLMDGQKADMVFTDPPYNVAYEGGTGLTIQNDDMDNVSFRTFLHDAFTAAYTATKAGRPIYVAHADSEGYNFRGALTDSGFLLKQCVIWVKNAMVMGRQDYQWQHEPILYGWKPGEAHKWYGAYNKKTVIDDDVDIKKMDKKQLIMLINDFRNSKSSSVVRENKPHVNDIHPTMKPVNLVRRFILNSSREEDVVLDLFGGGGSTLIAADSSNRQSMLMELDPKYVDVILNRWQAFTGKQAVHEETGLTFSEVENGTKRKEADTHTA